VCVINPPFQSRVCACAGNCNDDDEVTINELLVMVNIALDYLPISECWVGDVDGDGKIRVNEIIQAAINALDGCGSQQTPTPVVTPVLPHGHTCCECENNACTDFVWVEAERICPSGCQTFADAECEAPCHGGPVGGAAKCVSLTACSTDADCDDGNGCTADRCTIDGCTHACVCD